MEEMVEIGLLGALGGECKGDYISFNFAGSIQEILVS
jgi:hypothetical protein